MTPSQQKVAFKLFKENGLSKQNVLRQCGGKTNFQPLTLAVWKKVLNQFTVSALYTIVFEKDSIVEPKHIECLPEDLNKTIETSVGWSSVWFVLEGHCKIVNT